MGSTSNGLAHKYAFKLSFVDKDPVSLSLKVFEVGGRLVGMMHVPKAEPRSNGYGYRLEVRFWNTSAKIEALQIADVTVDSHTMQCDEPAKTQLDEDPSTIVTYADSLSPMPSAGRFSDGMEIIQNATYINKAPLAYPLNSRYAGRQGTAVIGLTVGTDGSTKDVELRQSSGDPYLDLEARKTGFRNTFVPATLNGANIAADYALDYVWQLTGVPGPRCGMLIASAWLEPRGIGKALRIVQIGLGADADDITGATLRLNAAGSQTQTKIHLTSVNLIRTYGPWSWMGTIRLLLSGGNWSTVSLDEVEHSGTATSCSEQSRDIIDENGTNVSIGPLDASGSGIVELLEPAKFLIAARPLYPHDQMLARIGGKVTLVFALDEQGKPKDVHELDASDTAFVPAARDALAQSSFNQSSDQATGVYYTATYDFVASSTADF